MLDLTNAAKKLYEIKMPDGEILKLRAPTQGLLMKLMDMDKIIKSDNEPMEVLNQLTTIVTEILNLNTANKTFTVEDVANMLDFNIMMLVIQDYFNTTTKTLGE